MDSVADMDKTILLVYLIYGGLIYVYLYGIFRRTFLLNFYGPTLG